jgi:hypothetical protein
MDLLFGIAMTTPRSLRLRLARDPAWISWVGTQSGKGQWTR